MKLQNKLLAIALSYGLTACVGPMTIEGRTHDARVIASQGNLTQANIMAPPFLLASWQRLDAPGAPVNVYIEGDGAAWLNRTTPSKNPTPKDAVALKLAAADPSPNVVYIARPCQFTDITAPNNHCRDYYWRGGRFAPEVIESFNQALDHIAQTQNSSGFHLVGFSGGANIAGLLAERRNDIITIRTVSGNIDNEAFTTLHKVSPMPHSLNMADHASKIAAIPQVHFVGSKDETIPPSIYQSYASKAANTNCMELKLLDGYSHDQGWAENWESLLNISPSCKN